MVVDKPPMPPALYIVIARGGQAKPVKLKHVTIHAPHPSIVG